MASNDKKTSQFIPSLYRMCNNDDETHRETITWSDDNASFWVSNSEKFARLILPMYFKHNNYASFVRQLNMYGFHRSTEPRGKVAPGSAMIEHFTHEYFVKGREDLLDRIHRKTSSNYTKPARSSRSSTPMSHVSFDGDGDDKRFLHAVTETQERTASLSTDVEILKTNQMQLASTVQLLHAQNLELRQTQASMAERLDMLVQALTMHNVSFDTGSAPDAQAAQERQQRLQREQQMRGEQLRQAQQQRRLVEQSLQLSQQQAQQQSLQGVQTLPLATNANTESQHEHSNSPMFPGLTMDDTGMEIEAMDLEGIVNCMESSNQY